MFDFASSLLSVALLDFANSSWRLFFLLARDFEEEGDQCICICTSVLSHYCFSVDHRVSIG